ncbi:transposase [uncultured Microbulbifer sp.]|uniref:transposase n=1 Tax=uncultured Microbulbifer sp. TaxID=348147 RepID=UPI00344F4A9E
MLVMGVEDSGKRNLRSCFVSLSEAEPHWSAFLQTLVKRSLQGITIIASHAHAGSRSARKTNFSRVVCSTCSHTLSLPKSCLRRVSTVAIAITEAWQTGKT